MAISALAFAPDLPLALLRERSFSARLRKDRSLPIRFFRETAEALRATWFHLTFDGAFEELVLPDTTFFRALRVPVLHAGRESEATPYAW